MINKNMKKPIVKDNKKAQAEILKHNQLLRASGKKGIPKFSEDKESVKKLLEGNYHDEDDLEFIECKKVEAKNRRIDF